MQRLQKRGVWYPRESGTWRACECTGTMPSLGWRHHILSPRDTSESVVIGAVVAMPCHVTCISIGSWSRWLQAQREAEIINTAFVAFSSLQRYKSCNGMKTRLVLQDWGLGKIWEDGNVIIVSSSRIWLMSFSFPKI